MTTTVEIAEEFIGKALAYMTQGGVKIPTGAYHSLLTESLRKLLDDVYRCGREDGMAEASLALQRKRLERFGAVRLTLSMAPKWKLGSGGKLEQVADGNTEPIPDNA